MRNFRVFIWIVIAASILIGAARLRFDTEILNVLPRNIEAVEGLKLFQEHFSSGQELIVTIESPSAAAAELAAEQLATAISNETSLVGTVMWRSPWEEHPDQAAELVAYLWFNQSPSVFAVISNRLSDSAAQEALRAVKEEMATSFSPMEIGLRAYDPLSLLELPSSVTEASGMKTSGSFFSSADGTFRVVTVEPRQFLGNYRQCRAWFAAIKKSIHRATATGEFVNTQVHFTGRPAFVSEISSGMEQDMIGTSTGTLVVIGLLFYLTHRRILPLIWLLILLVVMLGITTALGGLLLGSVNVMSIGFASILIGLGEDFAIVLYQEAQNHPTRSLAELRREAAPGIIWSAITAAGAFASLNFSSLPGLGQLGTFVALGLLVAATVMLVAYLPPLLRFRKQPLAASVSPRFLLFETRRLMPSPVAWTVTGLVICFSLGMALAGRPGFDKSPDPLRPKRSEAYETLAKVKQRLGNAEEPLWVIARGKDEAEVSQKLAKLRQHLERHKALADFTLFDVLWPNPENQKANSETVQYLLSRQPSVQALALKEGFTTNAMVMTGRIFAEWRRALEQTNVFWPSGNISQWVMNKVAARDKQDALAVALVYPRSNAEIKPLLASWPKDFRHNGIVISGWQLLGAAVFERVLRELPRVIVPILLLVIFCLWLAFRDVREVALSLAMLGFSALTLNGAMQIAGWKWNMLNLMAFPLLLGMAVDFSIHIQLALRKAKGDLLYVRRTVGKALLLAGATTIAGFGSLAFASTAGMASLGKTCALAIVIALVTAVYLLPVWWVATVRDSRER